MNKLSKLCIIAVLCILSIGVVNATWCDTDYAKRINVSVNNTGGSALTNYQVYVNLSANPINDTSLRVYNATSCSLRPHWCENETAGNCYALWINYSAVATSSWVNNTAIYYKKTFADSTSNISTTFLFGDDFERYAFVNYKIFATDGGVDTDFSFPFAVGGIHQPNAVYILSRNTTYMTYQTSDGCRSIISYNHTTDTFSDTVAIGGSCLPGDIGHGGCPLTIDGNGYIYVFYRAIDLTGRYKKSTNPYNITSWETEQTLSGVSKPYLNPWSFNSTKKVVLIHKNNYGGSDAQLSEMTYNGTTWTSPSKLANFASCSAYFRSYMDPDNKVLHVITTDCSVGSDRKNLYYMKSVDGGDNWIQADGTSLSIPIAEEGVAKIYDSGTTLCSIDGCDIKTLSDGNCVFVHGLGGTGGNFKFGRWNGTNWVFTTIATMDFYADEAALVINNDTNYRVYLVTGSGWGGIIKEYNTTDSGVTWNYVKTINGGQAGTIESIVNKSSDGVVELMFAGGDGGDNAVAVWGENCTFTTGQSSQTVGNGWIEGNDNSWSIEDNQLKGAWVLGHNYNICNHSYTPSTSVAYHSKIKVNNTNSHWYFDIRPEVINRQMSYLIRNTGNINYINSTDWQDSGNSYAADTYYEYIIKYHYDTGNVSYKLPDFSWSVVNQDPYTPNAETNQIKFMTGFDARTAYHDWVFVRKFSTTEPSSTLGSEEDAPATTPVISNVQNGSISSTSQYINWTVNQTAHNRVLYSNESDLTPAYYSAWDNSTAAPNITLSALDASIQYWYQAWSYNTTNTSLSDNSSTMSFTTAGGANPTLHIDNAINIKEDWGRDFNSNISANVTVANASGVWMNFSNAEFTNTSLGWLNLTLDEWVNDSHNINSPVTNISVIVTLNSTTSGATNDTDSFWYEVTNRTNTATMDSSATQNANTSETFYVNATCNEEYSDTFLGAANLLEDSVIIATNSSVTNYVNFSHSESSTGQYNYTIRFYNLTHYDNVTTPTYSNVTVSEAEFIPGTPQNLANTTGNFWVNHTWGVINGMDNITDSFNVSVNLTWYNGTTNMYYNNTPLSAHKWSNITVWSYNESGSGNLGPGSASQNTQIPNNVPTLTGLPDNTTNEDVNQTDIFNLDTYFTDVDGDTPTYLIVSNNQSGNVSVTINVSNNVSYTLASGWNGTASVVINATDGWGGEDNDTFLIVVNAPPGPGDYIPATPTTLANTTGNGWVHYTWASGGGANVTDSYNVSWNSTWYNTTLVSYMNDSIGEFGWANISVWAYNSSGNGSLSVGSVSSDTQAGGGTYTTSMTTAVYNLVSYYGSANSSAEQFGDDITNVDYVARYNNVNNTFTTHIMGTGGNNFTTVHGRGYFVYVNVSGSSTYNRNNISDSAYYTNLSTGWDTIGWTNATDTNAEGLISSLGSACKYTSMLNVDGWSYTTHTSGFTINDHDVDKGKGYWVWINTNTNWNRNS